MDEGTAIFKTDIDPPVGLSKFERSEQGVPTDHYLFLTGVAGKMLRKEIPLSHTMPERGAVQK